MKSKILRGLISCILIFSLLSFSASTVSASSLQSKTVQTMFSYTGDKGFPGINWEMAYYLQCKYTYSYNTGKISSVSKVSLIIPYCGLERFGTFTPTSVSTSYKISADGYSVTCKTSFYLNVSEGTRVLTVAGPFYGTYTFQSGVDYDPVAW